ncbi:MAG: HAD family hydrolase [Clostridia bacterium]|nr:HAD family hydrolase [Clostridia bacterium]
MSKAFDKTKYRLAAFDLDGTLLNFGKISEETVLALQQLHRSGITVAIATGRGQPTVPPKLLNLGCFDYVISSNGACVIELESGNVLQRVAISPKLALKAVSCVKRHHGESSAFLESCILLSWRGLHRITRNVSKKEREEIKAEFYSSSKITPWFSRTLLKTKEPIYKINSFFPNKRDCATALDEVNRIYGLFALTTRGDDLEITAHGVSKATGLSALCNFLGIAPSEVAAFGDSQNDYEMLQAAGFSVAMGNADEKIKRISDYIAPPADKSGAAKAIFKLFFDKED